MANKIVEDLKQKVDGIKNNPKLDSLREKLPFLQSLIGEQVGDHLGGSDEEIRDVSPEEQNNQMATEDSTGDVIVDVDEEGLEEAELREESQEKGLKAMWTNPEQRKKIIMVGGVLAIVLLLFEEEQPVEPPAQTPKVVKTKKVTPKKKVVENVKKSEPTPTKKVTKPIESTVAVETKQMAEPTNETKPTEPELTPVNKATEQAQDDIIGSLDLDDEQKTEMDESVVAETTEETSTMDEVVNGDSEVKEEVSESTGEVVSTGENLLDDGTTTEDVLMKLEDKLKHNAKQEENEIVYTTPRYNVVGRGLVYSCKGKHWACVNGENYGKCEKNFNFHKGANRPTECYPSDVYISNYDCGRAQQLRIDTNRKIDFCD